MKRKMVLALAALALALVYGKGSGDDDPGRKSYFVSVLPQAYLLERIGGDRIDVQVMVLPGKSPATYEPTPRQVMELGGAEIFFTLGVPFENNFLPAIKGTLPNLKLVDASEGIERRHLEGHHHEGEEEHEAEEEEGGLDPHVWMSPVLAKTIARNMASALADSDPEGSVLYEKNLAALERDLDVLDGELAEILAPLKGETLFVYHPSFGYLTDRYGLEQEAIEAGGKEPTPADLERIIDEAHGDGVRIILVQPEFSRASADAVARAIGGAVVPVEPLNRDYINNLKDLAHKIKEGLQ